MATIPLIKAIVACLKSANGTQLTAREIGSWIVQNYPSEAQSKLERSSGLHSDADLLQQVVREIGARRPDLQKKHPEIRNSEDKPRKYWWSKIPVTLNNIVQLGISGTIDEELKDTKVGLSEADTYPLLVEYLGIELGLYSKRVDDKKSSNRSGPKGNHWLFPDLVSMEDLSKNWSQDVKDCVAQIGAQKFRLWSFEVKLIVSRGNVRECYFQAVSNSSWANIAYLVATQIEGTGTLAELRILAALHGIGVILLDATNPAESTIIVPAIERENVDWSTTSRLSEENPDFRDFITLVKQFHQTGDPRPKDWDSSSIL